MRLTTAGIQIQRAAVVVGNVVGKDAVVCHDLPGSQVQRTAMVVGIAATVGLAVLNSKTVQCGRTGRGLLHDMIPVPKAVKSSDVVGPVTFVDVCLCTKEPAIERVPANVEGITSDRPRRVGTRRYPVDLAVILGVQSCLQRCVCIGPGHTVTRAGRGRIHVYNIRSRVVYNCNGIAARRTNQVFAAGAQRQHNGFGIFAKVLVPDRCYGYRGVCCALRDRYRSGQRSVIHSIARRAVYSIAYRQITVGTRCRPIDCELTVIRPDFRRCRIAGLDSHRAGHKHAGHWRPHLQGRVRRIAAPVVNGVRRN